MERAKKWIIVAEKLGAPVIRLFAGEIPKGYENKWDEVAGWMIECYKECAAFGAQHGVIIGIQNHGDMLQTAEQCIKVVKAVNSQMGRNYSRYREISKWLIHMPILKPLFLYSKLADERKRFRKYKRSKNRFYATDENNKKERLSRVCAC